MKRIISLTIMLCLMLSASITARAEEISYIGDMMVTNCKKCVSLRAEPTTESERLAWVDYHTIVENCYSGYGEYCYVEWDGVSGYIHSQYLEVFEGDKEFYYAYPEYYDVMQIVDCPDWTPLREMADVNADMLAEIPIGAVVYNCLYYADDYTYVEYNGVGGYVLTEYITLGAGNYAEPDLSAKYVTNCEVKVSLRAEPTSESERLAWVPKDTEIEPLAAIDGYFYVCYNGMYGYIFGDYLETIDMSFPYGMEFIGAMQVYNCEKYVSLRAQPDVDSERLSKVPLGEIVSNCYTYDGTFIYAEYDGLCGFILADYLMAAQDYAATEYYDSMQVVKCDTYISMYEFPGYESEEIKKVPLGAIVTECWNEGDEYFGCCYDGAYGYIDGYFLAPVEGPYGDSDSLLTNIRTELNYEGASFGVYLISDSMGGEWSIIEEKNHLENVIGGMPGEWWPLASTIADENTIEIIGGGELYLIIPADENAKITVNRLQLGYDGFTGLVEEELYYSENGAPVLVRCNEYESVMDCEIIVVGSDGSFARWYPCTEPNSGCVSTGTEGGTCIDYTEYGQY